MAKRLRRESAAILANLSRPLAVTGAFLRCAWPVARHFTSFGVRTGRTRQNDFVQSKGEANALPFTVVSGGLRRRSPSHSARGATGGRLGEASTIRLGLQPRSIDLSSKKGITPTWTIPLSSCCGGLKPDTTTIFRKKSPLARNDAVS